MERACWRPQPVIASGEYMTRRAEVQPVNFETCVVNRAAFVVATRRKSGDVKPYVDLSTY